MERFYLHSWSFLSTAEGKSPASSIEIQQSASPYYDWNERHGGIYAPKCASRLLDTKGRIINIVGNCAAISFDFGPTLLA